MGRLGVLLAAAAVAATASGAGAGEIKVLASAAVKDGYGEIVPAYEKASGNKVTTEWAGTNDIIKRVSGGEQPDMVILAGPAIDKLIADGKLAAGSRVDLVRSNVGIAVRHGAPKIDLTSGETLKAALLAAKSIAYSQGPSGVYIEGLFKKWGIADQVKGKVTVAPVGQSVGAILAKGEADVGFQQVAELMPVQGIDFLGPIPADVQNVTIFSASLSASSKAGDAVKSLEKALTSGEAAPMWRKTGMEPAAPPSPTG